MIDMTRLRLERLPLSRQQPGRRWQAIVPIVGTAWSSPTGSSQAWIVGYGRTRWGAKRDLMARLGRKQR